jgi:DNA-binding HxlR family transcriptional regulator
MTVAEFEERQRRRIAAVKAELLASTPPAETDPEVDRLVTEIIGRVADKWTMLVLEILTEHGKLRFYSDCGAAGGGSARRC